MEELTEVIRKKAKGNVSLLMRRMRDYHHPDATLADKQDKIQTWQKYNKFVIAVLAYWLKTDKKDKENEVF